MNGLYKRYKNFGRNYFLVITTIDTFDRQTDGLIMDNTACVDAAR